MIPNHEGWHQLRIKMLSALLREITYRHHGDFQCLNCRHSFATENGESHIKVCEHKYYNVIVPTKDTIVPQNLIKHPLLFMQI